MTALVPAGLWSDLAAAVAIKGALILAVAFVATRLLRRQPAAVRHGVWLAALLAQLAIPAFGTLLPAWRPAVPAWAAAVASTEVPDGLAPNDLAPNGPVPNVSASTAAIALPTPTPVSTRAAATPVDWTIVAVGVWAAGAALVLLWLVAGSVGVTLVARRAERVTDGDWLTLATRLSAQMGLGRSVVLLRGRGLAVPVTWGVVVPVVLLPLEADAWPEERRRAVLLHELAHVRRLDMLSQLAAHVVLALCWFDPLVWLGVRAMRAESERACDDCVLRHGTEASAYVHDLIAIVRAARPTRVPALAALAMARPTEFEGRVLDILDASKPRRAAGRLAKLATVAASLALVAPLAAMRPALVTEEAPSRPRAAVAQPPVRPTPTPTPNARGSWSGDEKMMAKALKEFRAKTDASHGWGGSSGGRGDRDAMSSAATLPLIDALSDADASVRLSAVHALGELDDPRAVDALITALRRDSDPTVRETAAWALGQLDDARAVPALSEALRADGSAGVRKQSAWALGQIEDKSAVDALSAATRDGSLDVRRMAVWALGQIEDPSALPALRAALATSDADTRKTAAWALGQIESRDAVDALTAAARDANADVRTTVLWALGQIEDERAVPTLTAALKDAEPGVRRNAAWALGQIESHAAVPALVAALQDADRDTRKTAAWALGQIEDPAAVNGLAAMTRSGDVELRRAAVQALTRIGGEGAVEALVALLKDADPEVRRAAVRALGRR